MLKRTQSLLLSVIGALSVVFVIANMVFYAGNQQLQEQVTARGQFIQQSVALQGLYQQIVRAVADLSVRNHDEQLQGILTKQGIHVTVHPGATGVAGSATAPAAAKAAPATRHRGARHRE